MPLSQLGKNIKSIRMNRNMTQSELGEIIDSDSGYISRIESGQKVPSLNTFIKIVNALNTTPNELLAGDGNVSEESKTSLIQDIRYLTAEQYDFIEKYVTFLAKNIKVFHIQNGFELSGKITSLGKNIKKFRIKKEMPMNYLCESVHISKSHFSNIENGTKSPRLDTLLKIAESLEVTPFDLLLDNFDVHKELLKSIFNIKELKGLTEIECRFIYENISQFISQIKEFS